MKNIFYILGGAVLLIASYKLLNKSDSDDMVDTNAPEKNFALQTQPQNKYPIQFPQTPRVDNADQPWYDGARGFISDASKAIDTAHKMSMDITSYGNSNFWSELNSNYVH